MSKVLINIAILFILIGLFYWAYTLMPNLNQKIIPKGLNYCLIDSNCAVFGKTGDCNCGCYNKSYFPSKIKEGCFCLAPISCRCVKGQCKEIFEEIKNFNDCVNAGYLIMESYPRQCKVSDETFTEDYCIKEDTGDVLTLSNAKEIAINSECGDNLKETFICNKITGTYWIDLNLEKKNCNPACVISIENRTAEINWRCMGLIE